MRLCNVHLFRVGITCIGVVTFYIILGYSSTVPYGTCHAVEKEVNTFGDITCMSLSATSMLSYLLPVVCLLYHLHLPL